MPELNILHEYYLKMSITYKLDVRVVDTIYIHVASD